MEEVKLGQYAIPVLLMVILGFIYKVVPEIPDRWKPLISAGLGVCLGLAAVLYAGKEWTFVNVVDYVLYGFMGGASAVGLYEVNRAIRKPRE